MNSSAVEGLAVLLHYFHPSCC